MHHVLGVGRLTEHAQGEPEERPFDLASQILERARVAFSRAVEQSVARFPQRIVTSCRSPGAMTTTS